MLAQPAWSPKACGPCVLVHILHLAIVECLLRGCQKHGLTFGTWEAKQPSQEGIGPSHQFGTIYSRYVALLVRAGAKPALLSMTGEIGDGPTKCPPATQTRDSKCHICAPMYNIVRWIMCTRKLNISSPSLIAGMHTEKGGFAYIHAWCYPRHPTTGSLPCTASGQNTNTHVYIYANMYIYNNNITK